MKYEEMKPQMNADERGFITTLSENLLLYGFHLRLFFQKSLILDLSNPKWLIIQQISRFLLIPMIFARKNTDEKGILSRLTPPISIWNGKKYLLNLYT